MGSGELPIVFRETPNYHLTPREPDTCVFAVLPPSRFLKS